MADEKEVIIEEKKMEIKIEPVAKKIEEPLISLDEFIDSLNLSKDHKYYYKGNFKRNEKLTVTEWKIITNL